LDFNKPLQGPVTPMAPAKHAIPADEPETGADWLITDIVIGPAERSGPATPDPMSVVAPSDVGLSLAARLCWRVPQAAK